MWLLLSRPIVTVCDFIMRHRCLLALAVSALCASSVLCYLNPPIRRTSYPHGVVGCTSISSVSRCRPAVRLSMNMAGGASFVAPSPEPQRQRWWADRLRACASWLRRCVKTGRRNVAAVLLAFALVFTPAFNPALARPSRPSWETTTPIVCTTAVVVEPSPTAPSSSIAIPKRQTRLGKSLSKIQGNSGGDPRAFIQKEADELKRWGRIAEKEVEDVIRSTEGEVENTFKNLFMSLQGAKLDTLILLIVTSAVIPLFKFYKTSVRSAPPHPYLPYIVTIMSKNLLFYITYLPFSVLTHSLTLHPSYTVHSGVFVVWHCARPQRIELVPRCAHD